MRRLALLVGLPLVLLFLLMATSDREPDRGEVSVEIGSSNVSDSRSAVVSRLSGIGGIRIGEDTEFDDSVATTSQLTFEIPIMRIEEALAELADVGGEVTSTRLDLEAASADAQSVDGSLGAIQGCLSDVAGDLAQGTAGAAEALDTCESEVRQLNDRVAGVGTPLETAELTVLISPSSGGGAALFWAIGILAVVLAGMAYLLLRSSRDGDYVDLSDPPANRFDEELRLRRN